MTDQLIWQHLNRVAAIQPLWWYTVAVIPASFLSLGVYLLTWFLLVRQRERLTAMLFWLVIASLPTLMILPSLYAHLAIGDALERIGITRPAFEQDIAYETAMQLGGYLSQLGWFGVAGALMAAVALVVALFRNGVRYIPPLQQRTEDPNTRTQQSPTEAYSGVVTATFERRPNPRVSAPYGVIHVVSGQRKGTHFGITGNMLIGSHRANLTINDPIVSGRHARLDIRDASVYLIDEGSRNGTYLRRNGKVKEALSGQPVLLQPDDMIILGNPDLAQAVQMVYEQPRLEDENNEANGIDALEPEGE